MTQQDVLEMLQWRPFHPFRIHLTDFSVYEIRHPEMVMVSRTRALVFYPPAGKSLPVLDHYDAIALLHITRLEPMESSAA